MQVKEIVQQKTMKKKGKKESNFNRNNDMSMGKEMKKERNRTGWR